MIRTILIIGGGGREHALAWKLSKSLPKKKIYAIPGNPGIAEVADCFPNVSINDNRSAFFVDISFSVVGIVENFKLGSRYVIFFH